MSDVPKTRFISAVALAVLLALFAAQARASLSGAVYTGLEDGSAVNANIYEQKEDVYLRGGPGPHSPPDAAALPAGDYYFQVTDPSGKVLLSEDPIECRRFTVSEDGVIVAVDGMLLPTRIRGELLDVSCAHATGIDVDRAYLGAITVQLMPYADTPNKGGVYKLWITPVGRYAEGAGFFGFIPAWSKTDNYKVRRNGRDLPPPRLRIRKFRDSNANGVWDEGEVEIYGWQMNVVDPLGVENIFHTFVETIADPAGLYVVSEDMVLNHSQTALIVNGVPLPVSPTVAIEMPEPSKEEEIHEVIFGNVKQCRIKVRKFEDLNDNGELDEGEPLVPGVEITVSGVDGAGRPVLLTQTTLSIGLTRFNTLLPGHYTVTETVPEGWTNTTPSSVEVDLEEGNRIVIDFGNKRLE